MNRITRMLQQKNEPVVSIYCTAGYPQLNDTLPVLQSLQQAGVDLVEIGMPFSDPLADGPVIQESSQQALRNGMSLEVLFSQLGNARETLSIPLILMGYLNPVLQYGLDSFLTQCQRCGIDGVILPDLPVDEYERDYQALFTSYGISFIFLVTPETPVQRLKKIDELSTGFLYAVSSSSTTGTDKDWNHQQDYFRALKDQNLRNPVLVGFGVKDHETFQAATRHTRGAIIGTAFIRALAEPEDLATQTKAFIQKIKGQ